MILAFRHGNDLFLGAKTLHNGQKEYIISSERVKRFDKSIKWLEIPQNYLLTISKGQKGELVPVLDPISDFIKDKFFI